MQRSGVACVKFDFQKATSISLGARKVWPSVFRLTQRHHFQFCFYSRQSAQSFVVSHWFLTKQFQKITDPWNPQLVPTTLHAREASNLQAFQKILVAQLTRFHEQDESLCSSALRQLHFQIQICWNRTNLCVCAFLGLQV